MNLCLHHDGNGCTLGLYGGRPSAGVCAQCKMRADTKGPMLSAWLVALGKAFGVEPVIRWDICNKTNNDDDERPCGCGRSS